MKDKVLLVGARYSTNLGDDVIYEVVKKECFDITGKESVEISINGVTDYMQSYKNNISKTSFIKKIVKKVFKNTYIYRKYGEFKSDKKLNRKLYQLNPEELKYIVFSGGQLFMNYFIHWIYIFIKFAEKNNIKVIFNCCGIGKINGINKIKFKRIINSKNVIAITIRDGVEEFKRIYNGNLQVKQVQDSALNTKKYFGENEKKYYDLGIGLISPKVLKKHEINISESEYISFIEKIIKICEMEGKKYQFFTNGDIRDQDFLEDIINKIDCEKNIAKRPEKPEELIALITSYSNIISFRLHSHIIATSYGINTIGLAWDKKVKEFFRTISREKYVIDIENINFEQIKQILLELFSSNPYESNLILQSSYETLYEALNIK